MTLTTETPVEQMTLTREQVGHVRHIRNLLAQLPGDWSFMQGSGPAQDDFGSLRYQLAYMTYALGITHFTRLPAAAGVYKPLIERAMEKLLRSDVWMYWKDTSRGGALFNRHLEFEEEWDPVVRDNIMYSAYVQSIAFMHEFLFRDDRYSQPGALTFAHYTPFWGEDRAFAYDARGLSDHIYWQMAQNGFLGVACEPNCVFQLCNQPAILGFRLRDKLDATDVATQVVRDYKAAWERFGMLDPTGHYYMFVLQDSQTPVPNSNNQAGGDAGTGVFLTMWADDLVEEHYDRQLAEYLVEGPEGTLSVGFPGRSGLFPPDRLPIPMDHADFGWTAVWAAEVGDADRLRGFLAHADRFMNPTWYKGGRFYPRNDEHTDAQGNRTVVPPIEGNALLSWAHLTVPGGLQRLYTDEWPEGHFEEAAVTSTGDDIDVWRAYVDPETQTLRTILSRNVDAVGDGHVTLSRLPAAWSLYRDGTLLASSEGFTEIDGGVTVQRSGDTEVVLVLPPGERAEFDVVAGAVRA